MLTVAFALAALGTAVIADRVRIPVLRAAVGALGALVLGRLLYDPTIVGGDPGRTPVFNWLLWGYGVPAASFLAAARILERAGRDRVVRLTEALGIAFAALLVFFEIRHALSEGDPLAPPSGHVEMGLLATASLLFALVMVRVDRRRPDPVSQVASLVFGALALAISVTGLLAIANPLLTDEPVVGSVLFNSLLLAYLLPAVLAGMLALAARGVRPEGYVRAAGGLALALQLAWTLLAIRHAFQGPAIGLGRPAGDAEFWTYSVALLLVGVALLALGLWRESRFLRLLSAGYIVAAVVKVFVCDLASLEGVTRALSFIGLGLALVGIGLAYQKLLARRQPPAPAPSESRHDRRRLAPKRRAAHNRPRDADRSRDARANLARRHWRIAFRAGARRAGGHRAAPGAGRRALGGLDRHLRARRSLEEALRSAPETGRGADRAGDGRPQRRGDRHAAAGSGRVGGSASGRRRQ
jgi:uncharacterized membrane protein